MPAIRRILCPLDFSRFSRHALEQAVALARECDAIVLGVGRRSPADLRLYGSTTQDVVRHARCPVLTIRV